MIETSVKIETLSSVSLDERHLLPSIPAVYFVLSGSQVLYVGRAINLRRRWHSQHHHKLEELQSQQIECKIAWLECSDPSLLNSTELAFIQRFKPEMNGFERSLANLIAGKNKSPRRCKQIKIMPCTIKFFEHLGSGSVSDGLDRLGGILIRSKSYLEQRVADGDCEAKELLNELEAIGD